MTVRFGVCFAFTHCLIVFSREIRKWTALNQTETRQIAGVKRIANSGDTEIRTFRTGGLYLKKRQLKKDCHTAAKYFHAFPVSSSIGQHICISCPIHIPYILIRGREEISQISDSQNDSPPDGIDRTSGTATLRGSTPSRRSPDIWQNSSVRVVETPTNFVDFIVSSSTEESER